MNSSTATPAARAMRMAAPRLCPRLRHKSDFGQALQVLRQQSSQCVLRPQAKFLGTADTSSRRRSTGQVRLCTPRVEAACANSSVLVVAGSTAWQCVGRIWLDRTIGQRSAACAQRRRRSMRHRSSQSHSRSISARTCQSGRTQPIHRSDRTARPRAGLHARRRRPVPSA